MSRKASTAPKEEVVVDTEEGEETLVVEAPAPEPEPAPAPSANRYPGHTIGRGHTHTAEIIKIQIKIGTPPDGVYGAKTELAVRRWQSARGLDASGVVDAATWNLMFA